ncbi:MULTISPECIES: biliverdin-producing heme oxygenase [unclassified Variovorax]|uniref:biliverdin-producing heme oxygenase n=1 Tax=unclassified Variovorax TaxID=663243 RepID=UPI0008BC6C11|nr:MULTISPECIES: biliverdin-producing heme oxygenase [unclassified Variovorax]SEK01995.1 Heme oxygenase [Variovorax sp. OK202]SFD32904.1 Heme oxygenase [Variovorax sp. OK212]
MSAVAAPSIADVLRALRTATHALHEALDSQLPIAREDASLADYAAHLRALRPWLESVRQALAGAGDPGLDRVARRTERRLAALMLDLEDASVASAAPSFAPLDAHCLVDGARDPAFAWGLAYVLEGSQLGGAAMHKRLGPRLAPHPMRYFQPVDAPEGLAAQWKDFVAQLAAALRDPAAVDAARRGAVAGFETLMPRFGVRA